MNCLDCQHPTARHGAEVRGLSRPSFLAAREDSMTASKRKPGDRTPGGNPRWIHAHHLPPAQEHTAQRKPTPFEGDDWCRICGSRIAPNPAYQPTNRRPQRHGNGRP